MVSSSFIRALNEECTTLRPNSSQPGQNERIKGEESVRRIQVGAPLPAKEELLEVTQIAKDEAIYTGELYVITQGGDIKQAHDVYFSSAYRPQWDWESSSQYVPDLDFLADETYLKGGKGTTAVQGWYRFFAQAGVKDDAPLSVVEEFAENFVKKYLEENGWRVRRVADRQLGYDFEAEKEGDRRYYEVKGQTHGRDLELSRKESKIAEERSQAYILAIVEGIPRNPRLYLVPDPARHGSKEKITIPHGVWRRFACG